VQLIKDWPSSVGNETGNAPYSALTCPSSMSRTELSFAGWALRSTPILLHARFRLCDEGGTGYRRHHSCYVPTQACHVPACSTDENVNLTERLLVNPSSGTCRMQAIVLRHMPPPSGGSPVRRGCQLVRLKLSNSLRLFIYRALI